MSQDKPESGSVPCPKVDWVHQSMVQEYLDMAKNPATQVNKPEQAYGWDFYTLTLGDKKMGVDVEHNKDPRKLDDVLVVSKHIGDTDIRQEDFLQHGQRDKAVFGVYDAKTGDTVARGRADFTNDNGNSYIHKLSGGIDDSNGRNVFFSADFDSTGKRLNFNTVKNDGSGRYTPDSCVE